MEHVFSELKIQMVLYPSRAACEKGLTHSTLGVLNFSKILWGVGLNFQDNGHTFSFISSSFSILCAMCWMQIRSTSNNNEGNKFKTLSNGCIKWYEEGLDLLHEGEGLGHCVLRGDVHGAVNQQPGYRRLFMWNIRAWVRQMMWFQCR